MTTLLNQSSQFAFSSLIYCIEQMTKKACFPIAWQQISTAIKPYCPRDLQLDRAILDEIIPLAFEIATNNADPNYQFTALSQLNSLFEKIDLKQNKTKKLERYYYPIQPLTAKSIFPLTECAFSEECYSQLLMTFIQNLIKIPSLHKLKWDLWLDHFDTALQCFLTNIPSNIESVSLYDQAKTTSAIATALWLWKTENQHLPLDIQTSPFLLIQGDFFGIQDFIFSGGSDTNKQAAKLLRGRSFQVSLFTELAALKVLESCELPSTSQIMNAAGKFLIVAPNIEKVRQAIQQVQQVLNQWFIQHTFGLIGLGIAVQTANCEDFKGENLTKLRQSLFQALEIKKLQRLDLTDSTESIQNVTYPYGTCRLNSYFPAHSEYQTTDKDSGLSLISLDQIQIGKHLTAKKRILIVKNEENVISTFGKTEKLMLSIFGYAVLFTDKQEETGKFGALAKSGDIVRFWDFSLPETLDSTLWNGYARRYINAYIPLWKGDENLFSEKYKNIDDEVRKIEAGEIKTFDYLACEDRKLNSKDQYFGQDALMTLKGDVDNLGTIFQKGLENASFAKMATLSRQMNQFFSLWLPAYCNQEKLNVYTVFAGGDDFFLIGAWHSIQKLAVQMQESFAKYVAGNEDIHFSAGMVMTKVGMPVPRLGGLAEEALEKAKKFDEEASKKVKKFGGKNAVTLYQQTISWERYKSLNNVETEIARLSQDYQISTSYLYALMYFAEQAQDENKIENTMWRSRFYYKTARYVIDKLKKEDKDQALNQITVSLGDKGIAEYKKSFIIPLFNYFYQQRH